MRNIIKRFFAVIFTVIILSTSTAAFASANNSLIISEINYFGSIQENKCKTIETDKNRCGFDKWFELYNNSSNAINLKNWKIQLRNSTNQEDTINITEDINIKPRGYIIIAYDEVNFDSALRKLNIEPNIKSGKTLRISNNEHKTIQIKLINPDSKVIFEVNLDSAVLDTIEQKMKTGKKYSIEFDLKKNSWVISTNEYYKNNFGTPKNIVKETIEDSIIITPPIDTIKTAPSNTHINNTKAPNKIKVIKPLTFLEKWNKNINLNPKIAINNLQVATIKPQQLQYNVYNFAKLNTTQPIFTTILSATNTVIKSQEFYMAVIISITYLYLSKPNIKHMKILQEMKSLSKNVFGMRNWNFLYY